MPQTPPKADFIPSLPKDWAERKVVIKYGEHDEFESVAVVPKGMFYGPLPGSGEATGIPSEWLLYVYDMDSKQERALRMCKVINWRAVRGAFKPG